MATPKAFYPIRVHGDCINRTRTDVAMRQHTTTIDEPPSNGGHDEGGLPLEHLMASFAGCTNVIANKIAAEMGIELSDMSVDIEAPLALAVVRGTPGNPFPKIGLTVRARSAASAAEIDALKTALAERCPVSAVFRRAGCEIVEDWQITPNAE
jgi:uncharacterized OsmC-like protein